MIHSKPFIGGRVQLSTCTAITVALSNERDIHFMSGEASIFSSVKETVSKVISHRKMSNASCVIKCTKNMKLGTKVLLVSIFFQIWRMVVGSNPACTA